MLKYKKDFYFTNNAVLSLYRISDIKSLILKPLTLNNSTLSAFK